MSAPLTRPTTLRMRRRPGSYQIRLVRPKAAESITKKRMEKWWLEKWWRREYFLIPPSPFLMDAAPGGQCYGRQVYSHRMSVVEPVFGNITVNKKLKWFSLRGKSKVNGQWILYCLVHNIEKIQHYGAVWANRSRFSPRATVSRENARGRENEMKNYFLCREIVCGILDWIPATVFLRPRWANLNDWLPRIHQEGWEKPKWIVL